jgi:hypothetical protein
MGWFGYVLAQAVLQYHIPRAQTHRPLGVHCESPSGWQAVPMVGNVATVVHTDTGAVPPVALPPALTPPMGAPPVAVPPVALPPVAVPPVVMPPQQLPP